jgi:hypothetical protein
MFCNLGSADAVEQIGPMSFGTSWLSGRKIGGGEPMLLILQEVIFAVLFSISAVGAADFLVRLLTALGLL